MTQNAGSTQRREQQSGGTQTQPTEVSLVELPSWRALLSNPAMRNRIFVAVIKSLTLNLALTVGMIGLGIVLTFWSPFVGVLWLFSSSFTLMARTYAKPWRLMAFTCLLPAAGALVCYVIQLLLFGAVAPPVPLVLGISAVGIFVGLIRARAHELYVENGTIMARRTIVYLIVWAMAYIVTQILGILGAALPLVHGGLLTGAFSTAMLIAVSLVILSKYQELRSQLTVSQQVQFEE